MEVHEINGKEIWEHLLALVKARAPSPIADKDSTLLYLHTSYYYKISPLCSSLVESYALVRGHDSQRPSSVCICQKEEASAGGPMQ